MISVGALNQEELAKIAAQLPNLSHLQPMKGGLAPDLISFRFPQDSLVPVAGAALIDAIATAEEARHALCECLAHQIWYLEHQTSPEEMAAVFFGQFYAADLALRAYSCGEHVANAVRLMLNITRDQLAEFRKPKATEASNVAHFLLAHYPGHPITVALTALGRTKAWRKTIGYRNRWTHDQPPTLEGLGMVYRRVRRWKNGVLAIGGSDEPEYTVSDLLAFMKPALAGLVDALGQVVEWYRRYLMEHGYDLKPSGEVTVMM